VPRAWHRPAQLRFTDIDGHRFTAFATDAREGQLADLEPRHRRRARCEDRIRCAKDTGRRNLPLKGFAQNQVWREIVALACELIAWTQMPALTGQARRWEPKRLRLFSAAGRLVRGGRRLRLAGRWPWATDTTAAVTRLHPKTPGPAEPRPPDATAGQPGIARARKSAAAEHLRSAVHWRERSRLGPNAYIRRP
jgi:Transposase DDE domain group 1